MNELKDKIALVTGASSGIGKAIAKIFIQEGANTVLCDLDAENGKKVAEELEKKGEGSASFIECDVSDRNSVESLFKKIDDEHGRIDVACNNAGIEGQNAPVHECSYENWDKVIDVNLNGVFNCMREALKRMHAQGSGSIVNISSVAGLVGAAGLSPYDASKHALLGLTKSAALDYGSKGIRVNAVCPGPVRTEMIERIIEENPQIGEMIESNTPNGRIGEPEEVAEAVLWLSSERSSLVTGHAMATDGGWVAK
jgi:NAD(P)-dependent dehydrogenase (short-subunit alcohol dehydrogenase family)